MAHSDRAAAARYAHDPQLSRRMVVTIGVLVAFYIAVMALLIWWGASWMVVLGVGAAIVVVQWLLAGRIVLATTGAQVVTADQAPELHAIVQRLCAMYDVPVPTIAVQPSAVPNAFAMGRSPQDALVCVTTGLLDILTPAEVEAVLAHELAHIAHRDVVVMTMSASGSTFAGALMRISALIVAGGASVAAATQTRRKGKDDNGVGFVMAIVLVAFTVMVIAAVIYAVSALLVRALSRYRELAADRSAVLLTGAPGLLASALTKTAGVVTAIPQQDLRAAGGVSALGFVPGFADNHPWRWLLSTHPTLQQRLDNIAKVGGQLSDPRR